MLRCNHNIEWNNVSDIVDFYGTWLKKDIDLIKEKVNEVDSLSKQMEIFDKYFKPVIYLKYGNPKWSMYGYDKH